MKPKKPHVHKWEHTTKVVPVRKQGDITVATDTLMQWVCKCGAASTYDLSRSLK